MHESVLFPGIMPDLRYSVSKRNCDTMLKGDTA
jgi:hypothetical protein